MEEWAGKILHPNADDALLDKESIKRKERANRKIKFVLNHFDQSSSTVEANSSDVDDNEEDILYDASPTKYTNKTNTKLLTTVCNALKIVATSV